MADKVFPTRYPNRVLDAAKPEKPIAIQYSGTQGLTTTDWFAVWGDYELRAMSAADMRQNLNVVNKSGDTMTGTLTNTSPIQLKDVDAIVGTAPSSDIWGRPYGFIDKNGDGSGGIRMIYRTNGDNQLHLGATNKNGSTTIENALRLSAKNDGTSTVWVSDKTAWRNALGASNGIWPTDVGGTGGKDSGDVSCTLGSGVTGDIVVRKCGIFVHFGMRLTTTGSLTANQSWVFGTIPAGYRPNWNITIPAGDRNRWGSVTFGSTGIVTYNNCDVAIGANTTIYAYTFYIAK